MSGYKLAEIALVKDILQIARTDTKFDEVLTNVVIMISDQVENICDREFLKAARTEYFESGDADSQSSQMVFLNAYPIDPAAAFTVEYASDMPRLTAATLVEGTDYRVDRTLGIVYLFYATIFNTEGFKITYTGGYALSATPGSPVAGMDYSVVQVPVGLKHFIAQKASTIHKNSRAIKQEGKSSTAPSSAITAEEREYLQPYFKRNKV